MSYDDYEALLRAEVSRLATALETNVASLTEANGLIERLIAAGTKAQDELDDRRAKPLESQAVETYAAIPERHPLYLECVDLRAELASLRLSQAQTWHPMETAPKDRPFIAYFGDSPQFVGWIDGDGWRVLMPPARGFGFGIHGNFAPFIPRGWMPLPPAPHQEDK